VSPLLRGVEVGLAHGFLLPGPFIKVGSSWWDHMQQ
jgi:photosystem I subunit 11